MIETGELAIYVRVSDARVLMVVCMQTFVQYGAAIL